MFSPTNTLKIKKAGLIICCAAAALAGCSKNSTSSAPPPLAADQVPATIENAFNQAQPEVKSVADNVASAVKNQDPATAFEQLQDLSARPSLTSEQRSAASRAMMTVAQQLQAAAANGDQKAQEALHKYMSTR
jgi:hypothetical protein